MSTTNRQALIHVLKVAAYLVGSSAIPALVSLYSGDARFLIFAPILNLVASYLTKYSEVKAGQAK